MRLPGLSGRHAVPGGSSVGRKSNNLLNIVGCTVRDRYQVDALLGEGSNAHVYAAHPIDAPDTFVVVKRIKPHVTANPRFRQFFDGEVASMRRFRHPYAVQLLDASLDDAVGPVMVLEYIPGVTLERVLAKHRRLSPRRAGRLLSFLLHALEAAHKAGIVHRDLKPANLMVRDADQPHESVRVMDFGFAGFTAKPHIQMAELTGSGHMFACGTPAYVSPEMVRGDAAGRAADIYAVGVMLFEALMGRLPFDVPTADAMLEAHLRTPPPRFHQLGRDDLPPRLEAVVMTALAKYPNERHQTARELCEDLSRAVNIDFWMDTKPAEDGSGEVVACVLADDEPSEAPEPFVLSDTFEAMLPERLAATKLKGFVDDIGGQVLSSEPGVIRVVVEPAPADRPSASGLLSFLSATRFVGVPRGKEPIEVELKMVKLGADRVRVGVCFRPTAKYPPTDPQLWNQRCEAVYSILRKFVMPG